MKSPSAAYYYLLKAIPSIFLMMVMMLSTSQKAKTQVLHPKVNEADSLALIKIYNAMNGPNWNYKSNWLTGRVHEWSGVHVPDYEDRVAGLSLSSNNLTGDFPTIESGLEKLISIYLDNNNLSGNFPLNICIITSLEYLSLAKNQFDGEIPESINELDKLTVLDLSKNNFTSLNENAFKPYSFPDMVILNLDLNSIIEFESEEIGSVILKSICTYSNLSELNLSRIPFNCPFPEEISRLEDLHRLSLYQCGLLGEIPMGIGNLTKIWHLDIGNNNLQGDVPQSLDNLVLLRGYFGIANNLLTGLPELSPFPLVTAFDIRGNRFTFEDIIPNLDVAPNVYYSPQRKVGTEISIICEPGDTKYLKWETPGDNTYQWFKDEIEIGGATENELSLESITFEDDGEYSMAVKNNSGPLLTLETYPVTIAVRVSLFDGLSGNRNEFSIKVVAVEGEVEVWTKNTDPVELRGGEVLVPGHWLYTGMESAVKLAFADNSTVVVQELTDVEIRSFEKLGNSVNTQLWLKAGEVDAAVPDQAAVKSDFKIRTPTATCSVRGTNFSIKHDSTSSVTTVMVADGSISVIPEFSPADSILLSPWQMVTVSETSIGQVDSFSLNRIEINPDTTRVPADNIRLFSAIGYDNDGNSTSIPVHWESEAGTFNDTTNFFFSGTAAGEYTVTATEPVHGLSASAVIIVKEGAAGVSPEIISQSSLSLSQNYPNPFEDCTIIDYELPHNSKVSLKIFNLLGEEVAELVNEEKPAGKHSIQLNAKDLKIGTYFYRIQAGKDSAVKKMLLMK